MLPPSTDPTLVHFFTISREQQNCGQHICPIYLLHLARREPSGSSNPTSDQVVNNVDHIADRRKTTYHLFQVDLGEISKFD